MRTYLEINGMQIYFSLLLLTLNVPLRIGKCNPGVHVPQVGKPWVRSSYAMVEGAFQL